MFLGRFSAALSALVMGAVLVVATPAAAQFSDSYNFIKAVRDSDGDKVNDFLSGNKPTLINAKDSSSGEGVLHIVVKRRDALWLRFLLSKGANPDLRDNNGNTAMIVASQIGFPEAILTLIGSNANVNLANNSGETPLIIAVQRRDVASVRTLLGAGANPKVADHIAGMSARDYAARDSRSASILKMIDSVGATPATPKGPVQGPGL